jgi:hypothetical protein
MEMNSYSLRFLDQFFPRPTLLSPFIPHTARLPCPSHHSFISPHRAQLALFFFLTHGRPSLRIPFGPAFHTAKLVARTIDLRSPTPSYLDAFTRRNPTVPS